MGITTLALQQIVRGVGITPALAGANPEGSYVPNDGRVFLQVQNASETVDVTVTVETPGLVDGLTITDLTVIVPKVAETVPGNKMIGPFPRNIYNDADGNLTVTFSATADVTIAAFRL